MLELFLVSLLFICLLAIEAFFSGSEITFISANKARLFRRAKAGEPRAQLAQKLLAKPETLFSTTVVGTTLAISASSVLVTHYVIKYLGYGKEWLTLLIVTPFILIFAEFVPKMAGRARADDWILRVSPPISWLSLFLSPLTRTLSLYATILKNILGESPEKGFFMSREELKAALPASRGTDVTSAERDLVERILEFRKTSVKEMLRPLIEVIAIEENDPLSDAVKLFSESGHSRIPVYQERIDRIVGILQGFDCLVAPDLSKPVKQHMQTAFFVPESHPIEDLLFELRNRPMAIVVNEYGGAEGIITLEDVIEEVVGEIEDEFDEPPRLYHRIGENSFIVSARIELDALAEVLGTQFPTDDDYQTLAGFLLKRMQKIPKKWDSTVIDGVEYVIQSATDRSIEEVYVIVHGRKP